LAGPVLAKTQKRRRLRRRSFDLAANSECAVLPIVFKLKKGRRPGVVGCHPRNKNCGAAGACAICVLARTESTKN
jgi:hypothetical protein